MKKILYPLLIVVLMSITSCSKKDEYNPKELSSNDYPFAIETMQKIVTAFDEEDSEALAAMFSDRARENYDIEGQIEEALEYYNGKSINRVDKLTCCDRTSAHIKDGSYKYKTINFVLLNMETDAGEEYSIDVYYVLVDEEEPSRIGLSQIFFIDPEDNVGFELAIGAKLKD